MNGKPFFVSQLKWLLFWHSTVTIILNVVWANAVVDALLNGAIVMWVTRKYKLVH